MGAAGRLIEVVWYPLEYVDTLMHPSQVGQWCYQAEKDGTPAVGERPIFGPTSMGR